MALNKAGLKSTIKTLCDKSNTAEEFAEGLANAIDTYVKTGTVTVAAGIALTAGGYAGATTATGTGTIS